MKKFPNASILSVITQEINEEDNLIFLYLKPIPDYYQNDKPHWYSKKRRIWEKENLVLNEWVVVGKDNDIIEIYNAFLKKQQLEKHTKFKIPDFDINENFLLKHGNRGENNYKSLKIKDVYKIPLEFKQVDILDMLCGYKELVNGAKTFSPLGFYEQNFIYNNIEKGIFGLIEYRTPYLTFHGNRETSIKGKGSKDMLGFYQTKYSKDSEYKVIFKNAEGIEIGNCNIDKSNGCFQAELSDYYVKADIEISKDTLLEKKLGYTLLQEIHLSTDIINLTFKDTYGRLFSFSSKSKNRPNKFDSFTWQQENYPSLEITYQKFSDKLKELIDFLGPKILIADPYYFAGIKKNDTLNQYELEKRQIAFLNALMHSAIEKGIEKIEMLGYYSIEKNKTENKKGESIHVEGFKAYEKIIKGFIMKNHLQKYFSPSTFLFKKSVEKFHSRYWIGYTNENGIMKFNKLVILTNSIQGDSDELDFIPIKEENQTKQIFSKYYRLYTNSSEELSI